MNDGLNPIKHAYGQEPTGPTPAPGTPEYVEHEALRTMKEALDALPRSRPDVDVVDAIKEAASAEALLPIRLAYDADLGGTAIRAEDARLAEFELLRTTKAALDRLPRLRPDASVVDAVKSAATAQALAPVRAVYGEAEPPEADSPQYAEYSLLSTTRAAVDQFPEQRPDASVIAAVIAAATPDGPALKVAFDRPARPSSSVRRWMPALAMAASVVLVAVTGLWIAESYPFGQQSQSTALVADAQSGAADDANTLAAPAEPEPIVEEAEPLPFGPRSAGGRPTIADDRLQGYIAARVPQTDPGDRVERRALAEEPGMDREIDEAIMSQPSASVAAAGFRDADTNRPVGAVSEWDEGEDVRVLSLRLNQLATSSEGLSWDSPPAPLGAPESQTDAIATEGFRAVRSEMPPARVDVQMRSTEERDNQ